MYRNDPFSSSLLAYIGKPLYCFNLDDETEEQEILNFVNAHYKDFTEGTIHGDRREEQTDNLAAYLGFSSEEDGREGRVVLTENSGPIFRRRPFKKLRSHPIKYLTDNLVSRLIINKPNYRIYTVNRNVLEEQKKTRTANKIAKSIFADPQNNDKFKEYIRQAIIFGEAYLEVFWNVNKGPRVRVEEVDLVNEDGTPYLDSEGKPVKAKKRINQGDWDIKLIDPRFLITERASTPQDSDWSIVFEYLPVDKLRIMYPEKAGEIVVQRGIEDVDSSSLHYRDYTHHTIYYKLYHKPTSEMPNGRIIEATPTCILRNTEYPHPSLIDKELFPIVQLRTVRIVGTERGAKSIVAQGKGLQLARNNLLNRAVRNLVSFPPFRVWEDRSLDPDKMRQGVPTDVNYRSGGTPPDVVTAQVLTQEELSLMDVIDEDLHKIFTVSPISTGATMPNMRSRQMFEFMTEQESKQTFPLEDDIRDALIKVAQLVFAYSADEYTASKKDAYLVRYFGDRNTLVQEEFDPEDLKEIFDIRIDTENTLADTWSGKLQQLSQITQLLPVGSVSPQWLIDKMELGDSEEAISLLTKGPELARRDIYNILEGKKVSSPQKWVDLLPYYEEFVKKLQCPKILDILGDTGYEGYLRDYKDPEKQLKGNDLIAFRLLDQINAVEAILLDSMDQQKAKGVIDPQTGQPPLQLQVYTKFPAFPMIHVPDVQEIIDPVAQQQQSIPQPVPGSMGNISPIPGLVPPAQQQSLMPGPNPGI